MKQMIRKRLSIVILTVMLVSLIINYFLQTNNARTTMYQNAQDKFWQVGQILDQNEKETQKEKDNLKEQCFIRAQAIAYIIQDRPEIIGNQKEIAKIRKLLQVDEFHLFDTEGNLYAGSEPKYFGYNFSSGEQMQFFLPMLEDYSLQLCQDITPNTAEGKMMQYAAVWREDKKGIVQVGLEPTTVLESMKKTELSYIFSLVTSEKDVTVYAIDPVSNTILGSTDDSLLGKNIEEIGLRPDQLGITDRVIKGIVNQEPGYNVFFHRPSLILGVTKSEAALYQEVNRSTALLALYLLVISLIMIASISNYIDRYIVDGISDIHNKLEKITRGNLDTRVEVDSTPEFAQLSSQLNQMVQSLLDTTNKISCILEMAKIPLGVYEYNQDMKRIMATSRLADILMLKGQEAEELFSDYALFEEKLKEIRSHPLEQEGGVYEVAGDDIRFIKMETFDRGHSKLGMIVDVTDDILEKKRIERERDIDLLTGLYSRRAFYRQIEKLFFNPQHLGHAVMLMADADNLKQVNDNYGHENGDKYLAAIAGILESGGWEKRIAARLSGDEFALLLYGGSSEEILREAVDRMLKTMENCQMELDDNVWIPVSFSSGCAFYPKDGTSYSGLLKKADEIMYEAKKGRKDKQT